MGVYTYDGPVTLFGRCISNRWTGETTAATLGRAKSNLICQYKMQHNITVGSGGIDLPGKIRKEEFEYV